MPNLPRIRRPREASPPLPAASANEPETPQVEDLSASGLRWINIESPGGPERAWLEDNFDFHALDLDDVLSKNQRPKIDEYPQYLFLVIHVPVFDRRVGRLVAGEVDIFVGPDFVITLPNQPLPPIEYLFERCRADVTLRENLFARGSGYLMYRLVDDSFDYCFPMLRKIDNKLRALEDAIFEAPSEDLVRDISNAKQEIINFRTVIRPQRPVLRDLEKVKTRYLASDTDLEIYFDDIVDAHERIWDLLENYKEVVVALEETNESIINHRVNDVLKVLTGISVIVLPLTLIASIFGMNVGLPGGGDPATDSDVSFGIVMAIMAVVLIGMVVFFRRRRWL